MYPICLLWFVESALKLGHFYDIISSFKNYANPIVPNLWPVLHSLTDRGPTHLNLKFGLMIVGFIIFNPDDHLSRTKLDLFKRSALLVLTNYM